MERRMKSKQGFHTRSKSLPSEEPLEPAIQRQSTYDDYQMRKMDGGGDQDVWMNSFSSWKMKRMKATSLERDRKAERDEVEQSQVKLKRKKSKTFREIVEEKQWRDKMHETSSVDTAQSENGEITEILNDLPSTNLDSDNEQELQKSPPVFEENAPPPRQNYREERDQRRNELKQRSNTLPSNFSKPDVVVKRVPPPVKPKPRSHSLRGRSDGINARVPEPEVITMTESSRVYAAPPPTTTRRASPPPTTRSAPMTSTKPQGSDSTDKPLTFREKVLRAQESEREAQVTHQEAKDAARRPYRPKRSNIFDKIKAFDSGEAFKKVVDDAVEANRKPETRAVDTEKDDYEDIVIIMTQRARSYKGFGFTTSGGYDEKKPLVVSSVSPESVAGYSDLRVGDQILSINKESTRRFNQEDVHQCLSQSILTGKLTCKVRRYPNGKVPEKTVSEPVFQKSRPPLQESKPPPAKTQTALTRAPVRDPPPPSTKAPVRNPPAPSARTHPPVPVERVHPTPPAERVRSPPVPERLQTLTEVEPPEDADLDVLRPERTKNALARARQMLDELEMDDESSSRSSEITDQSPEPSQQPINKPPFSQPIKANGPPRSNDSSVADDESQSSEEGDGNPEPAYRPTASFRDIISYHTPSSSLDEGSTRSQDSFPRGFRSIAAPRPRGQSNPPPVNGSFQSIPSKEPNGPQSDINTRRNEFFPEDEYDRATEPVISPDSENTSESMPAPRPIKPSTAYRKPFNREEERRRLERWNEEQERRRQEKYEQEQQRLREEEERALSVAAEVDRKKREQEERELEARRLERQRQQEELQQMRQRQLEEEEKRKKARLEKERLEREEADRKRQEEMERQAAERKQKEEMERKEREKEAAERKRVEEQERLRREREQREEAARELVRREQEEYARALEERERERKEQERIRLEEEEQKRLEEEEEAQRLEVEKWRRESEEREKADRERERAQQEAQRRFQEEERERIRAEEREKIRQEWEEERQRELEQLRLEKERLQREREELDRRQKEEKRRIQSEKERIKKEKELERDSPPVIEVPLSKMTNGDVMSAPRQSLSSGSSPRSIGHSSGSVGQSPRSVSQSPKSVSHSPRTVSPATQRTRENNQRNMMPERDRPPSHTIMSSYKDPSIPSNQHWLVEEANRRRLADQKGIERQPPPDVIGPPHNGGPHHSPHSRYPKGFDPQIPTRIPAQRRHPPPHSQEAPAKMTGVQRRIRGPEGEAERQRKMANRRSLPDLSKENAVPSNPHRTAQQTTEPPVGRTHNRGQHPIPGRRGSIPGRGSAFQEPNKNSPPNQAVSGKVQCCSCGKSLGRGAAMIIGSLGLHFHVDCFRCCVCSIQLGNGTKGTDVRIRASQLHCQNCYSNEAGFQFTEV